MNIEEMLLLHYERNTFIIIGNLRTKIDKEVGI